MMLRGLEQALQGLGGGLGLVVLGLASACHKLPITFDELAKKPR
jgi:hypothetical protein